MQARSTWRVATAALFTMAFAVQTTAQTSVQEASDELVVTLLGTGTPALDPDRFGFSNLVQAGGLNLLIDAGRGASIQLGKLGLSLGKIDGIFITHFHSDHVNGLADLYTTGYISGPALGGRKVPLELYGPPGTSRLAEGLRLAHLSDVETRMLDEGIPDGGTRIVAHEAEQDIIFEKNGVKVVLFPVLHGEKIKPSVGYRVDYKARSVVFSGDTKYDENIIKFSRGVDLLVHEAGAAPLEMMEERVTKNVLAHHTSPEDAGRVFSQAKPAMVVYSHVARMAGPKGRPTMREIVDRTRAMYSGPLVVGEDMMQFRIGAKGTSILFGGK